MLLSQLGKFRISPNSHAGHRCSRITLAVLAEDVEAAVNNPCRSPEAGSIAWRAVTVTLLCLGLILPSQAQDCIPAGTTDWIAATAAKDPLAAPVRPADCSIAVQTPPDFGWPDLAANASYQVVLTYPDGHGKTLSAPINWLNWDETLPGGDYTWQVRVTTSGTTQTSLPRQFKVSAQAQTFILPAASTLYSRASKKAHPRALPDSATLAKMLSQRDAGLTALLRATDAILGSAPQADPGASSAAINSDLAHEECRRTLNAAFAWVATRQGKYQTEAVKRLRNLAAWSPTGATAYTQPGMSWAAREITLTLALAYDWLQPQLDRKSRSAVESTLKLRGAAIYNDVIGSRSRIATHPYDSQGNLSLTALAATAVLTSGNVTDAKTWLGAALPQTFNMLSPWGGPEGGNANGTLQGMLDVSESLVPWYVLRWAVDVDIGQKAEMQNWNNFIAYFIPPGSPTGRFGDGAELSRPENWSRFAKGATWLAPTPLARWYISQPQLQADDLSRLEELLAPPADFTTAAFPSGTPKTAVFDGIGWVAMHSDLSSPNRTSVYFKSSPFGAFDHAHADQNSFVIDAGGERLAIDSGYYDAVKSPHWSNWYKQTKAHNAITFDNGLGQVFYESGGKTGRGSRITGHTHGSDYDVVYGDATPAYDGALTAAQRALVYLAPNLILVYDKLASNASRQWEWNIHSLNQMTNTSGTTARISSGSQSLCVSVLGGPTTGFRQTNQFASNPSGSWTAQWHGTFYSTTKSTTAEFVTLLNVGCQADSTTPTATRSNDIWTVNAGKKTMFIDKGVITVAPAGTTLPGTPPEPTPTSTAEPTPTSAPTATTATTATTGPFTRTPMAIPGRIEAENYDLGGEGVAYHDTTSGNLGGVYRSDGVDLVTSCDSSVGGYAVGYIASGEWLTYTVNVTSTGTYDVDLRLANPLATGTVHLEIDGKDVTGPITGFQTPGWCDFTTVTKTGIPLTAGAHVLRLYVDSQYLDLNAITFNLASASAVASTSGLQPYSGAAIAIPGTVEAENYDKGGEGVAYHDTTPGNTGVVYRTDNVDLVPSCDSAGGGGYVVGYIATGEWLKYTVNIATTGNYDIALRVANPLATGTVHLEIDGKDVTGPITGFKTASWCDFTTVTKTGIPLTAGAHVLRFYVDSQYLDINSITFSLVMPAESPAGTTIPTATQIVDANRDIWTVSGGVVYRNGAPAGFTQNVTLLYWDGTSVYQSNAEGGWWRWNGSTWEGATNPTATTTSSQLSSPSSTTSTQPTGEPLPLTLPSTGTRAVTTFESIGLYWTPGTNPGAAGCTLQYRRAGESAWKDALSLWYDTRNAECRGSLVQLSPGTAYQIQLGLPGQAPSRQLTASTWSETFPIARTVTVASSAQTLNITSGGSASGYVLYTGPATIDVKNAQTNAVTISAPYVIVRGLTIKGAQRDAILLRQGAHDVVIENNDISDWGAFRASSVEGNLGVDLESAVRGEGWANSWLTRLIVQRNKIHDPRYRANSWSIEHPHGPQGITCWNCGGNNVFRYNEINSPSGRYYNDGMGGGVNSGDVGFPGPDSDIYGNIIMHTWDDAIEAEGGGMNVRIWKNYIDQTGTGVASTVVKSGPIYIFRNVENRARTLAQKPLDSDNRLGFAKSGSLSTTPDGRRYLIHNTTLQATQSGVTYGLGSGYAVAGTTSPNGPITNTVSRNNIYQLWKPGASLFWSPGSGNDFGYDLYNGSTGSVAYTRGISGTPIYASGNGWQSESGGRYQLAPNSPGYDAGVRIPNFNDSYTGTAPDIGAAEAGTAAMVFGTASP